MRAHRKRGDHRRTAIIAMAGGVMLASLAGACLATSRATEPVTGNGPLPPPLPAGPAAPAPRPPRSFTVVATGDIAASASAGRPDYRRPLGPILPLVSGADLAICHLETPLGRPEPARALAELGYDTCSTASRHALDGGRAGVTRTLESLDRAGLRHVGTARGAAEAARPAIMNVKGVRVAQLAYASGASGTSDVSGSSGRATSRPRGGMPWLVAGIETGRILADARRARRAGARVVIVSLHWGEEIRHAATAEQIALAQRLLAAKDIDLIVGTGAHVVQPFGRAVNGKFVAYGMGHLLAAPRGHGRTEETEGIVTRFTFTRVRGAWKVTRAEFVPTYVDRGPPPRVLDVTAALADPRLPPARRQILQGVLHRTMRIVYSRGAAPVLAR